LTIAFLVPSLGEGADPNCVSRCLAAGVPEDQCLLFQCAQGQTQGQSDPYGGGVIGGYMHAKEARAQQEQAAAQAAAQQAQAAAQQAQTQAQTRLIEEQIRSQQLENQRQAAALRNDQSTASYDPRNAEAEIAIYDKWLQAVEPRRRNYKDFNSVVLGPGVPITFQMMDLAAGSAYAADISYYLATHKTETTEIAKMPLLDQALAIKNIETKVRASSH
jgi:hypothetical protein